jgi:arylsulfatase A-like enzyme
MTGRYAFRTGMTYNDTGPLLKPANEIMMPKVLKPAGYVTAQVGKWSQLPLQPSDWGFDEYLRFKGSGKYWNTQPGNKTYTLNGREVPLLNGEYLPDKMHEFVVNFIERHKDQPFYIYYAMSHVHEPILPTPDTVPGSRRLYRDNIEYMDKLVGKLMGELDRLKLREKTVVIFSSDNGTAPRFKWRCTIDGGKQLSGCKFTLLECGALVPMIVNWPGTTPAGKVSDNLISFVDFLPTLAELGGAKLPRGVTMDGQAFTPMFYGKPLMSPRDWIFVMLDSLWYDREMMWKLNQSGELFDMKNAPFAEPLVPAAAQNTDAGAARQRLQAVLTQLNPTDGKKGPAYGRHTGEIRAVTNRSINGGRRMDSQNANAPDQ